jgi:hypothetical protein
MGGAAAWVGHLQPPQLALFGALCAGSILFPLLLRWTGNLQNQDRSRILSLEPQLPATLRPALRQLIAFLVPRPA